MGKKESLYTESCRLVILLLYMYSHYYLYVYACGLCVGVCLCMSYLGEISILTKTTMHLRVVGGVCTYSSITQTKNMSLRTRD